MRHLRCPQCGFTGPEDQFEEHHIDLADPLYSCPKCGTHERLQDVMPLLDFLTNHHLAACRIDTTSESEGAAYIIRTQSGAEHFFSVVDCTTRDGAHHYATVSQLLDTFGQQRQVILL